MCNKLVNILKIASRAAPPSSHARTIYIYIYTYTHMDTQTHTHLYLHMYKTYFPIHTYIQWIMDHIHIREDEDGTAYRQTNLA